jgi:hypothetical protein
MPDPATLDTLQRRLREEIQPHVTAARPETDRVMARVREVLTPEQWARIPSLVRPARGPGRGGGPGGFGGQAGRPGQRAEAVPLTGVSPLATLDRLLANPLPVLLELVGPLGMSAEQVEEVQRISAELDRSLRAAREELGRRFDGVAADAAVQLLREIQPQVETARQGIADALLRVRGVLTDAQWQRVPAQLREFRPALGG